jgi:hypothetical protein
MNKYEQETIDLGVEAAKLMIRAAVQTIGDVDDETRNIALTIALGIALTTSKIIDESIPRIAATTYLANNEHS